MNRRLFIVIVYHLYLSLATVKVYSQTNRNQFSDRKHKPTIDLKDARKWPNVGGGKVSNDGKFVSYFIDNRPVGGQTTFVQSANSAWKREFLNASGSRFANNSKSFVFKTSDTLNIIGLGTGGRTVINNVNDFIISESGQSEWLAYRSSVSNGELTFYHLSSERKFKVAGVDSYQFSPAGKTVLVNKVNQSGKLSIVCITLENGKEQTVWEDPGNEKPVSIVSDKSGDQVVSIIERKENSTISYSLWYFDLKQGIGRNLVKNGRIAIDSQEMEVTRALPSFSDDNKRVFFRLRMAKEKPVAEGVKVDVWSYSDVVLQSSQLLNAKKTIEYTAVVNLSNNIVIKLESENEKIVAQNNEFVFLQRAPRTNWQYESIWNKNLEVSYYMVFLSDGSRRLVRDGIRIAAECPVLSPNGKWAVYYDPLQKGYISYNTLTGITTNVTKDIKLNWENEDFDYPEPKLPGFYFWLANDEHFLVYDSYDIWLLDPSGKNAPVNWTNSYGRINNIKFTLINTADEIQKLSLSGKTLLYLNAFDKKSKNRGYFRKKLGAAGDPQLQNMGPYSFGIWDIGFGYNFPAIKARDKDLFMDVRSSADEAPNYFITTDYKEFKFLTDIHPHKYYNWYTTELHNWTSLDGSLLQGILYKPGDFDSTKKYPVIFNYYDKRSNELNNYIFPRPSTHSVNIPFFVSNGFLVFVPDMHYIPGNPGKGASNSVLSAAQYLSKYFWVDSLHMGIQGHSFGGYETNFIITQTNIFKAACAASGFSDLISWYGSGARGAYPMYWAERIQGRFGKNPWEAMDLYIKNSPIYYADRVSTPLLMMNNKSDEVIPFYQGVEFYNALRRLGKKVWLLQYDNGEHSLDDFSDDAFDFNTRMLQFFNHYLKELPAPKWMSEGVPASMKGLDDGLEIEGK